MCLYCKQIGLLIILSLSHGVTKVLKRDAKCFSIILNHIVTDIYDIDIPIL